MNLPSPLEKIEAKIFKERGLEVFIKRDDLIHPVISGNKWRKLNHNIEKFKQGNYKKLLTFGGAYSNHIAATARAGKELGFSTIGIIRGDELNSNSNPTLKQAHEDGMELIFTKREEYDLREEKYYHEELRRRHGHVLIIPEGGANYFGVLGCQEILKENEASVEYVVSACGTGTTAAGLLLNGANVIGVSALKGGEFLNENIAQLLSQMLIEEDVLETMGRFDLQLDYHFGGYAKYNDELIQFMKDFTSEFDIPLDQVYTGKMMYALMDLIQKDHFPKGSKIMALHTGGLQGAIDY